MYYTYVFFDVTDTSTINAVNGQSITAVSGSTFVSNNSSYVFGTTSPLCSCETQETHMILITTTPGTYSIGTSNGTVVGAIYGPIPPFRPRIS